VESIKNAVLPVEDTIKPGKTGKMFGFDLIQIQKEEYDG
jgi:hypothetical protein